MTITKTIFCSAKEIIHFFVDVETGEPLDKAGGYGYQGLAAFFIKRIKGDYWNVVNIVVSEYLKKRM